LISAPAEGASTPGKETLHLEVLHGFDFLLQDRLLRSGFSPRAFQQLEQHFDDFGQFYGRQKIITHLNTAFCKVMALGAIL